MRCGLRDREGFLWISSCVVKQDELERGFTCSMVYDSAILYQRVTQMIMNSIHEYYTNADLFLYFCLLPHASFSN